MPFFAVLGAWVALRKESVDRNFNPGRAARPRPVALRKESVDRNRRHEDGSLRLDTSLSARRAWIEIAIIRQIYAAQLVALRKESVDRN